MSINDYDLVINLMKQNPGVTSRDADSLESTARYLDRNPNLNFVAMEGESVVGCVMSGHDGRHDYLQHLVVHPNYRRKGIARTLVENYLSSLQEIGIFKSHIDVLKNNDIASSYWESQGWKLRTDINRYSFVRAGGEDV